MSKAKRRRAKRIRASAPSGKRLELAACDLELAASADNGPPTFRITAYTGGAMRVAGWARPVVVNLAGLTVSDRSRPVLRDHDPKAIVGHTTEISNDGRRLEISGVVSGTSDIAREVVELARGGFPWRASIGAPVSSLREIRAGASAIVNGETVVGPAIVADAAQLAEVSFVSLAADDNTDADVAASAAESGIDMKFSAWLEAKGFSPDDLTDSQLETLRAAHAAESSSSGSGGSSGSEATGDAVRAELQAQNQLIAAEHDRRAMVTEAARGHDDIAAQAIRDGWDATRTQLEVLRAERGTMGAPAAPAARSTAREISAQVIEAAALMATGHDEADLIASYGEDTLTRVDDRGLRSIGLRDVARLCAQLDGRGDELPAVWGSGESVLRAATSTHSLASVVDNVMTKVALNVYNGGERPAEAIARIGSVPDFKEKAGYRLGGTGRLPALSPGGRVASGVVSDEKFTNQADTFAQLINISRKDFINDDISILSQLGTEMGFSALESLNYEAFKLWLSNPSSFFDAANGNARSGSDSVLSDEGLRLAHATFRSMKKSPTGKKGDSRRVNIRPAILLVPPELEHTALELMNSSSIQTATGSDATVRRGMANTHQGRYQVVVAPHLSDTDVHANASATKWWLLADPRVVAALEIVFLQGRRRPVLERMPTASDVLGLTFRAYFDFGTAMMDKLGGVQSAGA
jgi:hypothetical protein